MMRAAAIEAFGGPEKLVVREVRVPAVGGGVGNGAGFDNRRDADNGHAVFLHEQKRKSIFQNNFFVWRQAKRLRESGIA